MKKYKYVVIGAPTVPGCTDTVKFFNNLGEEGFDLVTVQDGLAYFKKVEEESVEQPAAFTPESIQQPESYNLQEMEKALIYKCVLKNNNKIGESAKELGISARTLYRKLEEYELTHLMPRKGNI